MILMVSKGSTISSMEYNREKEGIAIKTKITAGNIVHIISKAAACVTTYGTLLDSVLNKTILLHKT